MVTGKRESDLGAENSFAGFVERMPSRAR